MFCCTGFTRSRKAKFAISSYFFSMGSIMGCWGGILPEIKNNQDISNIILGVILVAAVFGAIGAIPVVSYVSERYGCGFSLFLGGITQLIIFPVVAVKNNLAVFAIGVFLLGFGAGWTDISMSAQAVICEKMTRVSTMGLFHAISAIGGLFGALFGGFLLQSGLTTIQITVLLSILLLFPELFLSWWLYTSKEEKLIGQNKLIENYDYSKLQEDSFNPLGFPNEAIFSSSDSSNSSSINNKLLDPVGQVNWQDFELPKSEVNYYLFGGIAFLCFLSYFGQGSIGDWSAIYLSEDIGADSLACTYGLVGFQLFVAIGTFLSDSFVMTFGRKLILRLSGVVAATGLALVVIANTISDDNQALICAVIGFSISGLGMSVVPPNVISIAGSGITGMTPSECIAYVSSIGYVGVLVGPPTLSGISQLFGGLKWSFAVVGVMMLLMTITTLCVELNPSRTSSKSAGQEQTHSIQ